jgi:hypothetical protein
MCSYGGYHRTFNVTRKCYSIKSGGLSQIKRKCSGFIWEKIHPSEELFTTKLRENCRLGLTEGK